MSETKIEWATHVWNPVRGCSRVSEGCRNCYAERQAARFSDEGLPFHRFAERLSPHDGWEGALKPWVARWTGRVELIESRLAEPLSWRKPRARVFVNSMSDLFHESLPDEAIDRVFAVMALCPSSTFLVLTKRAERMRAYMTTPMSLDRYVAMLEFVTRLRPNARMEDFGLSIEDGKKILANLWLGVSVEDQATADRRIHHLLATPAAVRFVSAEPLLGPVDVSRWVVESTRRHIGASVAGMLRNRSFDALQDDEGRELAREDAEVELRALLARGVKLVPSGGCDDFDPETGCRGHRNPRLDWVIVGGESGPGARLCDVAWVRGLRDQCQTARVPVFVKQLGAQAGATAEEKVGARTTGQIYTRGCGFWPPENHAEDWILRMKHSKGGDPSEWPEDLRVRELPAEALRP